MTSVPGRVPSAALNPFAIGRPEFDTFRIRSLAQSVGRQAAVLRYQTCAIGLLPVGGVYTRPVVVLHRQGCRQVRLVNDRAEVSAAGRAGLVSLVPAGWRSRSRHLEPCEGVMVGLSPGLLADVGRETDRAADFAIRLAIEDPVLEGMCEAFGQLSGRPRLTDSLGRAVAVHLLERYSAPRPAVGWLARALAAIDARLAGAVSVDDLAAAAGMSRAHFSREFKKATGDGPHAYLVARRVDKAKELLAADPARPLAEVAAAVGFCDQSHLTAQFRRRVGLTPGEYRLQV